MILNVIHTIGIRIITALISFIVLFLNAQYLGAKGLGSVGLIVLNVTIIVLFCNLIHGAIIYFSSRLNKGNLLLISYLWTAIALTLYYFANLIYPLIDQVFFKHLCVLGFLQASAGVHHYLILGKERIKTFNWISLIQSLSLISYLLLAYFIWEERSIDSFIYALYISYSFSYLLGFVASLSEFQIPKFNQLFKDFKQTLSYGFYAQAANTFQLLNYRISYFFLDALSGRVSLGYYTASVQLSEALLLPARSISTVQYARISKRKNDLYARRISLFFMKIAWISSGLGMLILLLIPNQWYLALLGDDFSLVKPLMAYMAIGIIALSAEVIISHYFSGTAQVRQNMYSAAIGLVVTLISCQLLIPELGAIGAAISTAASYLAMFLYLYFKMKEKGSLKWTDLLPNRHDWQLSKRLWKKFTLNRSNL